MPRKTLSCIILMAFLFTQCGLGIAAQKNGDSPHFSRICEDEKLRKGQLKDGAAVSSAAGLFEELASAPAAGFESGATETIPSDQQSPGVARDGIPAPAAGSQARAGGKGAALTVVADAKSGERDEGIVSVSREEVIQQLVTKAQAVVVKAGQIVSTLSEKRGLADVCINTYRHSSIENEDVFSVHFRTRAALAEDLADGRIVIVDMDTQKRLPESKYENDTGKYMLRFEGLPIYNESKGLRRYCFGVNQGRLSIETNRIKALIQSLQRFSFVFDKEGVIYDTYVRYDPIEVEIIAYRPPSSEIEFDVKVNMESKGLVEGLINSGIYIVLFDARSKREISRERLAYNMYFDSRYEDETCFGYRAMFKGTETMDENNQPIEYCFGVSFEENEESGAGSISSEGAAPTAGFGSGAAETIPSDQLPKAIPSHPNFSDSGGGGQLEGVARDGIPPPVPVTGVLPEDLRAITGVLGRSLLFVRWPGGTSWMMIDFYLKYKAAAAYQSLSLQSLYEWFVGNQDFPTQDELERPLSDRDRIIIYNRIASTPELIDELQGQKPNISAIAAKYADVVDKEFVLRTARLIGVVQPAPAASSRARADGEGAAKMTGEVGEPVAALTVEASPPPVKSAAVSETPETEGAQAANKRVLMITDNVVKSNHYGNMIIELLDYSEGAIEEVTWVVLSEGLAEQEEKENIQQAINEYKPDEILLYISDTTRLERILPMFNGMSVQNFSGMEMDDLRHAVERWMSA